MIDTQFQTPSDRMTQIVSNSIVFITDIQTHTQSYIWRWRPPKNIDENDFWICSKLIDFFEFRIFGQKDMQTPKADI